MIIRQPAVAGAFYPDSPSTLNHVVQELLCDAEPRDLSPKALIVPHAGFIYSGPIAASAYRLLSSMQKIFGGLFCWVPVIGLPIHLLVLHAEPQAFHKHIINPPSRAIHADADIVALEHTGELFTGELAALVGVE